MRHGLCFKQAVSYNHSLLLSMAGGEVIMHVEGCIVSSAVSVVHVDVYGESYVVNYCIFWCCLAWQIWIVLYVEGCGLSSAKSVVHVDVREG